MIYEILNHFYLHYANECLWFLLMAINFSITLLAFRFWGKGGLFIFAIVSVILANIQVLKQIDLFGMHGSMGDISYIGVYLISDILSENYGKVVARKLVGIGIFSVIATTIIMYVSLKMVPNSLDQGQNALNAVFGFFPRLVFASITAFTISQSYDIVAYQFWRNIYPGYSAITVIAFIGVFPFKYMLQIFITSCVLRTIISVLDTPFVYWSVKIKPNVQELG